MDNLDNLDNVDNLDRSEKNAEKIIDVLESGQNEEPLYRINHLVSANKLKTYIRIELFDKSAEVPCNEIFEYLKEQNIIYGIMENDIIEYCKDKEYASELIAACGKEPINGIDAEIVYNFDTRDEKTFEEDADGTIDFRNLSNVINVKKDSILCYIVPAQEGEDGIDVYGNPVDYKKGKNITLNYGQNTYVSEDSIKLLASSDGNVKFKNGKVFVEDVYRVNNVDISTGNIDFVGNVVISGDVKEGFSVIAAGDIKIRGMVEGAYIKSDGDVIISKGMNGMGKGSIFAKGNITSKYIENATIESEKNIYAEALINSEAKAGESIIIKGSTSTIIGGTTTSNNIIYAKTIGNKKYPETNLTLDLSKYYEEQKLIEKKKRANQHLEKDLFDKNNKLREIDEKSELIMNSSLDAENKSSVQKQLMLSKIKISNDISEIKRKLQEVIPTDNIANHKIVCKGIMYPNTRITIGWVKYRVREDISYSKIYNDGSDISIVPLNPSDID